MAHRLVYENMSKRGNITVQTKNLPANSPHVTEQAAGLTPRRRTASAQSRAAGRRRPAAESCHNSIPHNDPRPLAQSSVHHGRGVCVLWGRPPHAGRAAAATPRPRGAGVSGLSARRHTGSGGASGGGQPSPSHSPPVPHARVTTAPRRALPQLAVLLLGGDLDEPRLVDDAGGPVALLHNADDPRLVALRLLNVLTVGGRLLAR